MQVFIVTREEKGSTAMWPPFVKEEKAMGMVKTHVFWRAKNGAKVHRSVAFTPAPMAEGAKVRCGGSDGAPVLVDAPECVNCVIHETELINEEGGRTIFRVTQSHVQE